MRIDQLLLIFGILFLVIGVVEGLVLSRRAEGFDWKSHHASVAITLMRAATDVVPLWLLLPGGAWLYEHRLFDIPLGTAWGLAVLFLGQEFCYYWFHRCSHRIRWFWANHAVHHSPNELTFSAAYRLGITGKVTGMLCWFLPLCWLGFTPKVVITCFVANVLFQFWIHGAWLPKLGWLEGILNTPSAHRVHHAANLEYLDANYGGVTVIFDRLFGTYVPERQDVAIRYGLVQPMTTYNPLKICFAQYLTLWQDLRAARSVREVLGLLLAPPGWQAQGPGLTTEALRQAHGVVPQVAPSPWGALKTRFTKHLPPHHRPSTRLGQTEGHEFTENTNVVQESVGP